MPVTQRVLAIPIKRFDRGSVKYLTRDQMQAVLDTPTAATMTGQRDQLLLMLLYNTGARVSEIVGLKVKDVCLESRASVHFLGKGRKHRAVPLWRQSTKLLRSWLRRTGVNPDSPLLPNGRGGQ
jgi:site-specific recombinase XerD